MLDCCRTRRRGGVGYSERSRERSHADDVVRGGLERGESKDRVSPSLERCDREGREREREREREKYPARPKDLLCTVGVLRVCM